MTLKTANERQKMAPAFYTFGNGSPVYHIAHDLSSWWADMQKGEWRFSTGLSTLALQAAIGRDNATAVVNPLPNQPLPFVVNGATLDLSEVRENKTVLYCKNGLTINAANVTIHTVDTKI